MLVLSIFIGMAVVILVLIEINERVKAKKAKGERFEAKGERFEAEEACEKKQSETENCSDCSLIDICEKKQ